MIIRFLEDTFIRTAANTYGNPLGFVFKGAEVAVKQNPVEGEVIEDNRWWYCDDNGWYYWSGKAEIVQPLPAVSEAVIIPDLPKQESDPPQPNHLSDMEAPVFINKTALPRNESIPEGETRLVPLLEDLLLAEERFQRSLSSPSPEESGQQPTSRGLDDFQDAPPETNFSRGIEVAEPEFLTEDETLPESPDEATAIAFWKNPAPQQLNWGIRNYLIAQDWWQKRQLTGKGIRIALLSTGAAPDHSDLTNIADYFQFPDSGQVFNDAHGFGTQAAVIAAGTGKQVFGVAPEASLLIAKIGDQDYALTPEGLMAGISWAMATRADIIAMLVDYPDLNDQQIASLQTLIGQAAARGILLLAPVGNSDRKKPESRFPACLEQVLSVGAHDQYGQRCSFSAKSFQLDVLAPGDNLLTSSPEDKPVNSTASGAVATAFTAGLLALICQWQREHGLPSTPDYIFSLLQETAASRRAFSKGEDVEYGYGLLNPIAILKKLDSSYAGIAGQ